MEYTLYDDQIKILADLLIFDICFRYDQLKDLSKNESLTDFSASFTHWDYISREKALLNKFGVAEVKFPDDKKEYEKCFQMNF